MESTLARTLLVEGSLNFSGTLDHYHNVTGYGSEAYETGSVSDTAVVLVLAIILFVLVSAAVMCINSRNAHRQTRAESASDGRTVCSKEDEEDNEHDMEEGQTEGTNEETNKGTNVPVIVVVVPDAQ